jgi:hypothetical protein
MILDFALSLIYGCLAHYFHVRRSPRPAHAARLSLALWPALLVWLDLPRSEGSGLRALLLTAILTATSYALIRRIRTISQPTSTPPLGEGRSPKAPGLPAFLLDLASVWLITLPASLLILVGFPFGPSVLDLAGFGFAAIAAYLFFVGDAQLAQARRLGLQTWYKHGIRSHVREPALVAQACLVLSIYLVASAGGVGLISLLGPLAGLVFLRRQARLLRERRLAAGAPNVPSQFLDYFPSLQAAIGQTDAQVPLDESSAPLEPLPPRAPGLQPSLRHKAETQAPGDHSPVGTIAPPAEGWWTPPKSPPKA